MVGPFIFFDHIGPVDLRAGHSAHVDVRPHPHIGLSTVTYLFEGEIMHRDSVGSEQAMRPGEVNWMTAGRGITHSERFEQARREGDRMHGIQTWVALPDADEETSPASPITAPRTCRRYERTARWARLIAGEAFGGAPGEDALADVLRALGARRPARSAELPADYSERAAYVAAGAVESRAGATRGPAARLRRAGTPARSGARRRRR